MSRAFDNIKRAEVWGMLEELEVKENLEDKE